MPPDTLLFAAIGKVTPEKRISQVMRALAGLRTDGPRWHLLLCGDPATHYDARRDADRLGIGRHVTVTGYLADAEMPAYYAAADVCLCLRWPSSRETSASWLRCLAAGKATIVTDLAHTCDIPSLDPRDWRIAGHPLNIEAAGSRIAPVCISIDILDEDHSLGLAVTKLHTDDRLRSELGAAARRLWSQRFTLDRMTAGYRRVLARAEHTNADHRRRRGLPPHLIPDGMSRLRSVLEEVGIPSRWLADFVATDG